MKEKLITVVKNYIPVNEQEETDKTTLLRWLQSDADISTRDNLDGHLTASAWVVNPERTHVLMAYHGWAAMQMATGIFVRWPKKKPGKKAASKI